jgi:hypothetical protein
MLRIVSPGMIANLQVTVVEPLQLYIVKKARTLKPEDAHMATLAGMFQRNSRKISPKKPAIVVQGSLIAGARSRSSRLSRWIASREHRSKYKRNKHHQEWQEHRGTENSRGKANPAFLKPRSPEEDGYDNRRDKKNRYHSNPWKYFFRMFPNIGPAGHFLLSDMR